MRLLCAHLGARLCLHITTVCAPYSQKWQGSSHLVLCTVCVVLSFSMWLLLRSPALRAGLVSWPQPQQCLQHRASELCWQHHIQGLGILLCTYIWLVQSQVHLYM